MTTKFTITDLEELSPCSDGLEYARQHKSLSVAWDKCERSDWMIWILKKRKLLDKPTSVKLACICAQHVLEIYEKKYPDDKRPRQAIEVALKWLKEPTEENRKAADAYAEAAAYAAAYAYAAAAAYAAADAAAAAAAAYAYVYAAYAADAAADAADAADARKSERKWQADQIRKLVSNPFK